MLNNGKCPKCDKVISSVRHEHIKVGMPLMNEPEWHGISYICPSCSTVLSVSIDPVALKNDTITALLAALRQKK